MTTLLDLLGELGDRPVRPDEHDCGGRSCFLRGLRAAEIRLLLKRCGARALRGCLQPPRLDTDKGDR